jgi:citrate synthase
MASDITRWSTAIAEVQPDDVILRGYRLSELVARVSFTEAAYLVVVGELPTGPQLATLDALLVSLVDHGISPSSIVARTLASCGTPMQASLAGGMLTIGDWHGGAGEEVARYLTTLTGAGTDPAEAAASFVAAQLAAGRRIEGFGHPQHAGGDPRALRLLDIANQLGTSGVHCQLLVAVDRAITSLRGPLGINVNGAIAAVLLDLGFPATSIRGVVIAARSFGLLAHVIEESEQNGRWRHAPGDAVEYTGPHGRVPSDAALSTTTSAVKDAHHG